MEYSSLEQRIAGGYLAMLPEFVPLEQGKASTGEQREFYGLMKTLYQLLLDDPGLLIPTLHEDDAYPTRYKKAYGKPQLDTAVLKAERAVKTLLNTMFLMG